MKLYIFRHGRTDGNDLKICQTPDFELNSEGIKQAEELRDKLAPVNLQIIYASPFKRANKTGSIVASAYNTPVEVVDGLQEMRFGEAEGMYEADMIKKYGQELFEQLVNVPDSHWNVKIPGGESKSEALERFKQALAYIKKNCRHYTAGVATHGHVMRLFWYDRFNEDRIFDNCEYFELEI